MRKEQKGISLEEIIRQEAHTFLDKKDAGVLDPQYGSEMSKRLSAAALKSWFPDKEPPNEVTEQFAQRVVWHLSQIYSREFAQRRLEGDIAQCLHITADELFQESLPRPQPDEFSIALLNEAGQLLKKAEETTLENADTSYVARVFHRLVETYLHSLPTEEWPTDDISAIAQTAETYFKREWMAQPQLSMARFLGNCLHRACEEEGRKVVFPVFDYSAISDPEDEELDDYGTSYDPLLLRKFTQRIFQRALLRVRGIDTEIIQAIREFDEAVFPGWQTREEYACDMELRGVPPHIREKALANFDTRLASLPERTPEAVAGVLQEVRSGMLAGRAEVVFKAFQVRVDHGMRCGIAACLLLSRLYAESDYLFVSDASEDEINQALPSLTELKEQIVAYFADWLTKPLETRRPPGKQRYADLSRLSEHYGKVLSICEDAQEAYSTWRKLPTSSCKP